MRGRQVIDAITYQGTITSTTGGVKIKEVRVPLEDVAVIILGNRTSISGGAMSLCARYDVIVLNCDWRGIPDFVPYGWSQNSRVATRHRCQAEPSEPPPQERVTGHCARQDSWSAAKFGVDRQHCGCAPEHDPQGSAFGRSLEL